ncbi:MAG: hypothetical protein ACLTER_08905 [Ruminococcus sp.]
MSAEADGARYTISSGKTRKSSRQDWINYTDRKDDVITFEQLGVDRLFVDEARHTKTVAIHKNAKCNGVIHIGSAKQRYVYDTGIWMKLPAGAA